MTSSYPKVLSEWETLARLHEGASIARYGDGELKLISGGNCVSQVKNPKLAKELQHILRNPGKCLVAIPNIAAVKTAKDYFWNSYNKSPWIEMYDPAIVYGSAFVTRPDSAPWIDVPEFWSSVIDLWRGRDVVLVKGSERSLRVSMMSEAGSVTEVTTAYRDAYAEIDALVETLKNEIRRVLLCCGATATVLAWRLAQVGVHALDLGHIGMTMRRAGQYRSAWEAAAPPVTFPAGS